MDGVVRTGILATVYGRSREYGLYIDPGAGSLLIQALIAALVSVPILFRNALRRAIHRVSGRRDPDAPGVQPPA